MRHWQASRVVLGTCQRRLVTCRCSQNNTCKVMHFCIRVTDTSTSIINYWLMRCLHRLLYGVPNMGITWCMDSIYMQATTGSLQSLPLSGRVAAGSHVGQLQSLFERDSAQLQSDAGHQGVGPQCVLFCTTAHEIYVKRPDNCHICLMCYT